MQENTGLIRKKSRKRVSKPEELNDYIRVTTPYVWIVLLAIIVLLVGSLLWSIFGTVNAHDENGSVRPIHPIEYLIN